MTGEELYRSVIRLGYAESLDDLEGLFYEAANLALCRICRQFPLERTKEVIIERKGDYYTVLKGESLDGAFEDFAAVPVYEGKRALSSGRDYLLRSGDLLLPPEKTGILLSVCYTVSPSRLTADNMQESITCRRAAIHLLPLLTASILWAQDDTELADRCYSLFRNAQTELLAVRRPLSSFGYEVIGGWDR